MHTFAFHPLCIAIPNLRVSEQSFSSSVLNSWVYQRYSNCVHVHAVLTPLCFLHPLPCLMTAETVSLEPRKHKQLENDTKRGTSNFTYSVWSVL